MARTAPAVTGTATAKKVSLRFIDVTGDFRADSYVVPLATTAAQIETMAQEIADLSDAALYAVIVSNIWGAIADPSDAVVGARDNATNNWVITVKHPDGRTGQAYVPAPIDGTFIAETDDPLSGAFADAFTAILAVFGAGWSIYSVRYVERRDRNKRTLI